MTEAQVAQLKQRIDNLVQRGFKIRNANDADDFYSISSDFAVRLAESEEKSEAALDSEHRVNLRFHYERWFSEAKLLVAQLLPDRIDEFLSMYQRKRNARWEFDAYTISDFLTDVRIAGYNTPALHNRFNNLFESQISILRSSLTRLEPRLNDLHAAVAGDVFKNMLSNAAALLEAEFVRPAAALAGVVVESHLHDVCIKHKCLPTKKNPTISIYNDSLKQASIIDQPTWRLIARIADIRNIAVHRTGTEPTKDDVGDIVRDAARIIGTVY